MQHLLVLPERWSLLLRHYGACPDPLSPLPPVPRYLPVVCAKLRCSPLPARLHPPCAYDSSDCAANGNSAWWSFIGTHLLRLIWQRKLLPQLLGGALIVCIETTGIGRALIFSSGRLEILSRPKWTNLLVCLGACE
jgi:hypothetical protein